MLTATEIVGVSQVFPAGSFLLFFLSKIAIRWAAFKIGSLEVVATPWFKDPALVTLEEPVEELTEEVVESTNPFAQIWKFIM